MNDIKIEITKIDFKKLVSCTTRFFLWSLLANTLVLLVVNLVRLCLSLFFQDEYVIIVSGIVSLFCSTYAMKNILVEVLEYPYKTFKLKNIPNLSLMYSFVNLILFAVIFLVSILGTYSIAIILQLDPRTSGFMFILLFGKVAYYFAIMILLKFFVLRGVKVEF